MAKESASTVTVQQVLHSFKELPDPRYESNRHFLLGDIIVISILAVLAGADGPTAIGHNR